MKKQVYEITKNVISNLFLQNPVVSLAGGTKCVFAVFGVFAVFAETL